MNGFMDLKLKDLVRGGAAAGPGDRRDRAVPRTAATASCRCTTSPTPPTRGGRSTTGPTWARRRSRPTCRSRATSSRAAIDEAHKRGMKITGHLCSVTYAEAADLGIDNLEHGFLASTDFVADKQPDVCPGQGNGQRTIAALDRERRAVQGAREEAGRHARRAHLDADGVRDVHAGAPDAARARRAAPELKAQFEAKLRSGRRRTRSRSTRRCFPRGWRWSARSRRRAAAAGRHRSDRRRRRDSRATRISGSSSCWSRRASRRSRRSGSATLNGATFLGRADRVGSIAAGKQADLVVIDGDPSTTIADIRKVETVFKQGVGFDPAKLIASVKGKVGLW